MSVDTTPTIGLKKPDDTEFYDIEVHNANCDKIDSKFSEVDTTMATKADKNTVYTALEAANSVAQKIKDSVKQGIFKGTFYVINADDCPKFALIRYSATYQGYTNVCNVERFDIDMPKQYTRRIDATLGVWKDSEWKEIPTTESCIPTLLNGWHYANNQDAYRLTFEKNGNIVSFSGTIEGGVQEGRTLVCVLPDNFTSNIVGIAFGQIARDSASAVNGIIITGKNVTIDSAVTAKTVLYLSGSYVLK